ncbi:MAG: hypothetical protein EKK55_15235 [Rhodocyclaceae bacterium]|nr:MAG: hypothetical protein EKK55_15235 [Rhodocyclaceae bacterium]
MDALQRLADLGRRFHGSDLSFRRPGTDWPAPWRARLNATKNEPAESRMEAFAETAEDAVAALIARAEAMDAEQYVRLDVLMHRSARGTGC